MPLPVSLKEIVDEMLMQNEELRMYVNRRTGECVSVTDEEALLAGDGYGEAEAPDWMEEVLPRIREVLESDDYLPLPSQWDIHEYHIMEQFCTDVGDEEAEAQLLRAIRGGGAFRYFRDTTDRLGLTQRWYAYRDAAVARIAVRWLLRHDIPYVDDVPPVS